MSRPSCWRIHFWQTLMLVVLCAPGPCRACEPYWYGPNCNLPCYCEEKFCSDTSGCLEHSDCLPGHFGPSCLFVDNLPLFYDKTTPDFLRDGDYSTCMPQDRAKDFLEVSLTHLVHVSWLRLVLMKSNLTGQSEFVTSVSVKLNSELPCQDFRLYISHNVLDITCRPSLVNKITFKGRAILQICDVHLNTGANLALIQATSQSSTANDDVVKFGSHLAVDGSPDFLKTCARTKIETKRSLWAVSFSVPRLLYRVDIFVPENFNISREEIIVTGYDEHRKALFNFSRADLAPLMGMNLKNYHFIHQVADQLMTPVSAVAIKRAVTRAPTDLILCDVRMYGATICSSQRFGLDCAGNCECRHRPCHKLTGDCWDVCSKSPFSSCGSNVQQCPEGTYGPGCSRNCSRYCLSQCDQVTGHCNKCGGSRIGEKCEDCHGGYYGYQCSISCPSNCDGVCAHETGDCLKCSTGFAGLRCDRMSWQVVLVMFFSLIVVLTWVGYLVVYLGRKSHQTMVNEADGGFDEERKRGAQPLIARFSMMSTREFKG